jgi:Reverse transcriptase (RNA-dependent DNA polymerase)
MVGTHQHPQWQTRKRGKLLGNLSPIASWLSIHLIMNIAVLSGWTTRQLDFVLAFPQVPVETDLYMEIPPGFSIDGSHKHKVLKLVNNLYGQKQAGRVWNLFLTAGLVKLGFTQCQADPCIFWREFSTDHCIYR